MNCPYCDASSQVLDSRPVVDGVRRRRRCKRCERRFTTYERLAPVEVRVHKRNGTSEDFDPQKLERTLRRLTRRRSVPPEAVRRVVRRIEARLLDGDIRAVRSSELAGLLLEELERLDAVARSRFEANYLDPEGKLRLEEEPSPTDESEDLQYRLPLPG